MRDAGRMLSSGLGRVESWLHRELIAVHFITEPSRPTAGALGVDRTRAPASLAGAA